MVRCVRPAVDGDSPIARLVQLPGHIAGSNRWSHAVAPSKFSGLGIVIKKRAQPRASHSPAFFHDDLANKKRAARAALEGGGFELDLGRARADGRRLSLRHARPRISPGMALYRAFPPRTKRSGARLEMRPSATTRMAGTPPGTGAGGHDEVKILLISRQRKRQAWQHLFRKLAQERNYVNQNVTAWREISRISLFDQPKLCRLSDLNRTMTSRL